MVKFPGRREHDGTGSFIEELQWFTVLFQVSVVKEVEFGKSAVFPKISGVDEAYIGLLPGNEFIKLVTRDDGT